MEERGLTIPLYIHHKRSNKMNDFEVIQELRKKVSVLEEENKILKEFVEEVKTFNTSSLSAVYWTKKEEKYKNIDWSY